MPRVAASAALLLAVAAIPSLARGANGDPNPATLSVFVPDSSIAAERFVLAEKLQNASEWTKAAEIYQELLDSHRDRVVPAGSNPESEGLYVSVADRALRQLAAWPAEGLAAYNGRFQPAAEALLASATDPAALRAVVERYLLTRAGQAAAGRLMQTYWDQGDVASAARLAQRVASLLPQESPQRPLLLLQAGMAWQLSGNAPRAKEILASLKTQYPTASAPLGGEQVNIVTQLEHALLTTPPADSPSASWPAFGGSPDRAAVPSFGGRSDALLFSVNVAGPAISEQPSQPTMARLNLNQSLGIHPVYDNRELFFLDGRSLHAVTIDGGLKLPGWQNPSIELSATASGGPCLRSLAVTADAIYAVLSDLTVTGWAAEAAFSDNSLIASVDRQTGKVRWRMTPAMLSQETPSLKATQFASAPLVIGNQVYVAARGGRNAQFHDVYLLAFAADTGKLQFASYIASGPNLSLMLVDEMSISLESGLPQLSYHAGRIIISTNIGAVAAVESSDGTPAWLRVYARADVPQARLIGRMMRPGGPGFQVARIYAASPAIIAGGQVFALPVDGKSVLVLDEVDGRLIKQIPRSSLGNVDTLIGLKGQTLVVAGERSATAIDWTRATEDAQEQSDAVQWSQNFQANTLRGRPFLTNDSLFLPTDDRLLRITTRNWKVEQATPPTGTWEENQGPGNVLVTDEHVVIATATRVNVYTNLAAATARLDKQIAANPMSPEPLVRYGELLFAAGRPAEALTKLQEAAKLVRSEPTEENRDRLFSAALTCASRLAMTDAQSADTLPLLEVAHGVIGTPAQAVQYHLTAATLNLRRNDGRSTLAELQAILDDSQQRIVLYRDADGSTRYAADLARKQVAQLIDRYGISLYQPIEQKARETLSTAQSSHDVAALQELARRYPNSTSAPAALYVAGQLLEDSNKLADAASTYRQLVQDYPSHAELTRFIEAMARVYAAIPGKAAIAAGRLAHGAAMYGDPVTQSPMRLPDGQVIQTGKFSEVSSALKAAAGLQTSAALPDLRLPPLNHPAFAEPVTLQLSAERILPTSSGTQPDYRRAAVLSPNGDITVIDNLRATVARFAAPRITVPLDCAWISPSRLLVKNMQEIVVLDLATKAMAWRIVPEELPTVAQIADETLADQPQLELDDNLDEGIRVGVMMQRAQIRRAIALNLARREMPPDGITDLAIAGNKVVFGTSTGRLAAVDAASGKLLWQLRPESGSIARISCSDDFTAAKVVGPKRSMLLCVDNDTGKLVYIRSFQNDPIQNVLVTPDGQLIYTTPSRIASKDLFDSSEHMLFDATLSDQSTFSNQDRPDQLLLVGDLVAATTTNNGNNGNFVRLFSRFSGKQILPGGRDNTNNVAAAALPPTPRASRTRLIAAEPFVYASNQSVIRAINLQRIESPERRLPPEVANLKSVTAGAMHLVAIELPFRPADNPVVPQLSVFAFSRAPVNNGESGRLDHAVTLKPDTGISSFQLMEGGLLLTTGDKHLLFYPSRVGQ